MTINNSALMFVRKKLSRMGKWKIFSIDEFNTAEYSRSAIQKALIKLVKEKVIVRIIKGVYFKPKISRILKGRIVSPMGWDIIMFICNKNKETIQIHGGIAANRLRLSTQVPLNRVFLTSGYSRKLYLCGSPVKFIHTSDKRKLQHAGTNVGLAISAMYYLGKNILDKSIVQKIKDYLTEGEYEQLKKSDLPVWMKKLL